MERVDRSEVVRSLEGFVGQQADTLLKSVAQSWQPSDYLPDLSSEGGAAELEELRASARSVPDEVLVVLVGNMVTEEALPSYQTWLNGLEGVADRSGTDEHAWARWSRGWTSEEKRHGDLMSKYLYLCGRIDMRAVESTIQHLIRNGFNPETENDPYLGLVYTSFQETATKVSHRNVAIRAAAAGDSRLRNICGVIAGDEARHETAYRLFMGKVFELDPSGAVLAFARMMRCKIVMPARLMEDGREDGVFDRFSLVAQRIGVYTAQDYAAILEELIRFWNVRNLTGLSGDAAEAQDYVCGLPARYRRAAQRLSFSKAAGRFSWIRDREA